MSSIGGDSTPCHSAQFQTVLPSILFLLVLQSLIIPVGTSLGQASRTTESASAFEFPTVYFPRDSFQLDKKGRGILIPLVGHLKTHPGLQVWLIGRVDDRQSAMASRYPVGVVKR